MFCKRHVFGNVEKEQMRYSWRVILALESWLSQFPAAHPLPTRLEETLAGFHSLKVVPRDAGTTGCKLASRLCKARFGGIKPLHTHERRATCCLGARKQPPEGVVLSLEKEHTRDIRRVLVLGLTVFWTCPFHSPFSTTTSHYHLSHDNSSLPAGSSFHCCPGPA